jgi:hypothetical protein
MRHPYPDAPSPETRRARWIRRAIVAIQTLIFLWALLTQVVGGNGDSETDSSMQPPSEDRAAEVQHAPATSIRVPVDDIQQIPALYLVDTAVHVSDTSSGEQVLSGQPDERRQYTQSPYAVPMTGCGGAD